MKVVIQCKVYCGHTVSVGAASLAARVCGGGRGGGGGPRGRRRLQHAASATTPPAAAPATHHTRLLLASAAELEPVDPLLLYGEKCSLTVAQLTGL